jgi:hypothetical protein
VIFDEMKQMELVLREGGAGAGFSPEISSGGKIVINLEMCMQIHAYYNLVMTVVVDL